MRGSAAHGMGIEKEVLIPMELQVGVKKPTLAFGGSQGLLRAVAGMESLWKDPRQFRVEELRRSEINKMHKEDKQLFISHCWRKTFDPEDPQSEDVQGRKRQIISHLSCPVKEGGPGLVYWADFLNLLAEGPVPWRKEIEEAVNACSKMVCIIDEAWVTSFNCLQELAFAIREEKPVVVLVLDQLGWEFLTVPGGSKRAWDVSKWGPSLSSYAGQEIVPGEPFTLQTVENLYSYLSGINLCACRKLEVTNFGGMQGLLDNMRKYVTKDLLYFKQHAELKEYARKWEQAGKPSSVLLHRKEALKWQQWVDNAESMGAMPSPTALQKMFVKHSMLQARNMILRLRIAGIVLLALILIGAASAGVMASLAERQRREAEKQRVIAEEATRNAQNSAEEKEAQAKAAELARERACFAFLEADRDRHRAQIANNVSTAALIQSALNKYLGDPSMAASEIRMYMKAASLLDGTGRTLQEGQFRKTIEDRTREPVWIVQDPLVGHRDEVTCAAWSPLEPHLLATGSHDGTVRLWDTKEDEVFEFTAHNSSILAVAWSSVQRGRLASGSHDGTIAVWDTTLKPEILKDHFLEGHGGAVNTLAWSPVNVAKLASGGSDKSVLLWSLGTGEFRELTGHTGAVTSLGWYPWSETWLISGSEDSSVRLWDLSTVSRANILSHNGAAVTSLAFSAVRGGGHLLATGSSDGRVRVWSDVLRSRTLDYTFPGEGGAITSIVWDETPGEMGSRRFATISAHGVVRSWHLPHRGGPASPQNHTLPLATGDGTLAIGALAFALDQVEWSTFNASHMTAATAIRTRGTVSVQIWNLAPPSRNSLDMHSDHDGLREETEIGYLGSEGLAIDVVAWQPPLCPGLALAIAFTSGWIDVWDFEKGLRSGYWHGSSSGRISSMSWAPWTCGLLLVSYLDGSLRLLRLDGETAEVLVDGLLTIKSAAWSSEVQGLLAFSSWDGSAGKVQLLDIGRGTNGASPQILDSLDSEPGVMSWSSLPGGRLALSGADKQPNRPAVPTIMIWEVSATSWSSFNVLKGHTLEVESIAWSPADLDVLASGAFDNTISIWNVVDGTRKVLNGHSGSVTSISWSPDAKHLASAARVAEGVVRLWETNSWSNRVIEGPKWVGVGGSEGEDIRGFTTLAFAPHGDILVTGSVGTLTLTAYSSVSRGVAGWFNVLKEMHQWSNVTVTENDLRLYSLLGALEDTEVSVSETTDEARKEYCQTPSRH